MTIVWGDFMKDLHYDWMTTYTPQREWIEGTGKALWLAFFFSEIGAGLYLLALFEGQPSGMVLGWLLVVPVGGSLHMAYLGRPMKAWRAILRPGASELSRGIITIILFAAFGALQLAPTLPFMEDLPWSSHSVFFMAVMGILSLLTMMHGFMVLSSITAVPFWNTATLVVFSITSGMWVGSQLAIGTVLLFDGAGQVSYFETWSRGLLLANLFAIAVFVWDSKHGSEAKRTSLRSLFQGRMNILLCVVGVGVGLGVPMIITMVGIYYELSTSFLVVRILCAVVGDAALRYGILKGGLYTPLISR